MAELKTKPTTKSAKTFLGSVIPETKRKDGFTLLELFQKATGEKPVMWGKAIVGFGKYHYKSERSSQEGDWPLVAFSPRKQSMSIYALHGSRNGYRDLLRKLGKHKTGVGCLYINTLSDINLKVLGRLVRECYKDNKKALANPKAS